MLSEFRVMDRDGLKVGWIGVRVRMYNWNKNRIWNTINLIVDAGPSEFLHEEVPIIATIHRSQPLGRWGYTARHRPGYRLATLFPFSSFFIFQRCSWPFRPLWGMQLGTRCVLLLLQHGDKYSLPEVCKFLIRLLSFVTFVALFKAKNWQKHFTCLPLDYVVCWPNLLDNFNGIQSP